MLFLAVVLVPLSRRIQEPPGIGTRVLSMAARRFRIVGWVALLTLVGSGFWTLADKGISPADIATGEGSFFQALRTKVVLVGVVLLLSALHDFILGPRLVKKMEVAGGPTGARSSLLRQRLIVSWLARINLLLALAIVVFGVILA